MSRQQSHIVHKAFDQLLVLVGLLVPHQPTLSANFLAGNFDLEFVCPGLVVRLAYHVSINYHPWCETVNMAATYFGRRNLSQVDLILQVFVAHTVFFPIPLGITLVHDYQFGHIAIEIHLNVHADAPVKKGAGAVNMNVGHRHFYYSGEYLSGLVVCSHTYFGLFLAMGKSRWELHGALLGEPVLRVGFVSVVIGHRYTRLAERHCACFGTSGKQEGIIQKLVEGEMLLLCNVT
jgi:hypothetical protein